MLVRATRARRVLEIGTSNGYSTLWLADAVQSTGGHLESLEIDPARTQLAGDLIARAGLQNVVTLRSTSAAEALRHYEDGTWELVFVGAAVRVRRLLGGPAARDRPGRHAGGRQRALARARADRVQRATFRRKPG